MSFASVECGLLCCSRVRAVTESVVKFSMFCRAENFNTTAVELLRRLPGVSDANYRSLMAGCTSIAEMALLSVDELAELMGGKQPARMLRDFLNAKCPTLV